MSKNKVRCRILLETEVRDKILGYAEQEGIGFSVAVNELVRAGATVLNRVFGKVKVL